MKNKQLKHKCFLAAVFVFSVAFVISTLFFDRKLAFIGGCAVLILTLVYFVQNKLWRKEYFETLSDLAQSLGDKDRHTLETLPVPAVLSSTNGSILWYNKSFGFAVADSLKKKSTFLGDYLQSTDLDKLFDSKSDIIEIEDRTFSVFVSDANLNGKDEYLIYFFDISELKSKADKLDKIKPCVIMGMYDNFDEMFQSLSDSELSELTSSLDKAVSKWFSCFNCVLRKVGSERFFVVCHEEDLQKMTENKFSLLSITRNFIYNEKPCLATLSVGIGKGEDLRECDLNAKQALDMALSRGGDQVAIRNAEGYDFYGGLANNIEKGSRVRSRVVASAIKQLVINADNAIIIGHKFADYDAIGTAIGVYKMMKHFGKNAFIVYDNENTLAEKLVQKYVKETGNTPFIDKKSAIQKLNDDTLVFLVDTHRAAYSESPEIVERAKNVVVIDHHRKAVDYFDKAVVFHHNSSASSASEMFTELLEYITNVPFITQAEADALLAGIMLDTKNFVLRSGARTFDAASYLKSRGADSVKVKKLFSTTTEEHKSRTEIVSSAIVYRECAISVTEAKKRDIRIVTSQAADELLNISGVKASFVLFKTDDLLNISARSFGEVNVQIIMEKLGGGGHLTMAATQMRNTDARDALVMLKKAIDNYYESL